MGRSVWFRVDTSALERLLREIERTGGMMLVEERTTEAAVPTLPMAYLADRSGARWLVLPEHLGLVRSYLSIDGTWVVRDTGSPVISLMVFQPGDADVSKGRLYFRPGFYAEDGTWERLPEDFIRWADRLLRWARRNLERGTPF